MWKKKEAKMMEKEESSGTPLAWSFVAMVLVGLGNKIFQKLQTIPMRNYPNFLNLFTTFVYIPFSFAYILPMLRYGKAITPSQLEIPKGKFAVMGILDSIAGIMQVFGATYLGGSLLILLGQAAIPISMVISKLLLKVEYSNCQYMGSFVVVLGILLVLGPSLHDSSALLSEQDTAHILPWSLVVIASCIPMCLSSVYKEKALGETTLDPIYLNGWIAIFQFFVAIPLSLPAAAVGDPPVLPYDLPENLWDGFKCYLGTNSILDGPHKDDCGMATVYVSIYILFNLTYNVLIILILKFGSANILWLAMTIMVPLGNVAFTFHFMPGHVPLRSTDIGGLFLIMSGLFLYRFLPTLLEKWQARKLKDSKDSNLRSLLEYVDDDEIDEL